MGRSSHLGSQYHLAEQLPAILRLESPQSNLRRNASLIFDIEILFFGIAHDLD